MPQPARKTRRRRIALAALAVLAGLLVVQSLLRNQVLRRAEAVLSAELGAEVRVGEVETMWPRRIVLRDLRAGPLERHPLVRGLRADRLSANAPSVREGLAGRHDEMWVEGLVVTVGPRRSPGREATDAATDPATAGPSMRVELRGAVLELVAGDESTRLPFGGSVASGPEGFSGQLHFESKLLPMKALLPWSSGKASEETGALGALGTLGALEALDTNEAREALEAIAESSVLHAVSGLVRFRCDVTELAFDASGGRLMLDGVARELGPSSLRGELGPGGAGRLELRATAEWAAELSLLAERRDGEAWRVLEATAREVDVALLTAAGGAAEGLSAVGRVDLSLRQAEEGDSMALLAEARLETLRFDGPRGLLVMRPLRLELSGSGSEGSAYDLHEASLSAGSWSFRSTEGGLELSSPSLTARTGGTLERDGAFTSRELEMSAPELAIASGGQAISGLEALVLRVAQGRFEQAGALSLEGLEGLELRVGTVELAAGSATELWAEDAVVHGRVEASSLSGGGSFAAEGRASARSARPTLAGHRLPAAALLESTFSLERAGGGAPVSFGAKASLGGGLGRLELEGGLGPPLDLDWTWRPEDPGRLLRELLGDEASSASLEGLSASGRLEGERTALAGQARLSARSPVWSSARGLRLEASAAVAELSWPNEGGGLAFRIPPLAARLSLPDQSRALDLRVGAQGRWLAEEGAREGIDRFEIDRFEIDAGALGTARGESSEGSSSGELTVTEARLSDWLRLALPEPPEGWPTRIDGLLDAHLTWRPGLVAEGELRLEGAGFETADGRRTLVGASAGFDLSARWDEASGRLEATTSAGWLGGFELAWDEHYGDWREHRAGLDLRVLKEDGAASLLGVELRLDEASRISLELQGGGARLSASFADLGRSWSGWLVGPTLGSGLAAGLELGGSLEVELAHSKGPDADHLSGRLRLAGVDAALPSQDLRIHGLELELPLDLHVSGSVEQRRITGPLLAGRLAFERLELRRLAFAAFSSDLEVHGDSLRLEGKLVGRLFGGLVELRELELSGLLSAEALLQGRLDLHGLDVAEAARELALPPLEGRLEASFPVASLSVAELVLQGRASAGVFGGEVETTELRLLDPFGPTPKARLSIGVREIDLARLTTHLGFGRVTGRLDGRIDGLSLQGMQPVGFLARFETVKQRGLPQRISVQAADDITSLGSGQPVTIFDRGLLSLVDEYAYARAGFEAELHHSVITLRGVERRGSRELFVRGRAPLRLDVVNADPGRALSFQGLLDRLKNLNLEGVLIERGATGSTR